METLGNFYHSWNTLTSGNLSNREEYSIITQYTLLYLNKISFTPTNKQGALISMANLVSQLQHLKDVHNSQGLFNNETLHALLDRAIIADEVFKLFHNDNGKLTSIAVLREPSSDNQELCQLYTQLITDGNIYYNELKTFEPIAALSCAALALFIIHSLSKYATSTVCPNWRPTIMGGVQITLASLLFLSIQRVFNGYLLMIPPETSDADK